MKDQAATLRLMTAVQTLNADGHQRGAALPLDGLKQGTSSRDRTVAIASGKGGVGKSNLAANVALELAALGRRVSLLDADLALANADVLLGLNPTYHLGHVLTGERSLRDVIIEVEGGVRLIPGGSGVEELANLTLSEHTRLIHELRAMEDDSDFMLIDTAAGIAANVTGVLRAAAEVIIVTTPDPTSVVDAYATIKVIHAHSPQKPIWLVVNHTVGIGDADQIFSQLRTAAARFLGHEVKLLGNVPRDPELAEAVRQQTPVVNYAPDTAASRAFRLIAKQLDAQRLAAPTGDHSPSFWGALVAPDGAH
ncbi:MAG: MinD/ParA family protein [Pyrinomonadaceae bacterium]